MLKEVSAKEALSAAIEGKPALQIHKYHGELEEELMVEDLTEKIGGILKRKDSRYLIDIPAEKTEKPKEEKKEKPVEEPKAVLTEPKETENSESKYEMAKPEEKSKDQTSALENFHVYKGRRGRPQKVDVGEIMALHRAGWSAKKIAEETKSSVTTVKKYIDRMERESGIR